MFDRSKQLIFVNFDINSSIDWLNWETPESSQNASKNNYLRTIALKIRRTYKPIVSIYYLSFDHRNLSLSQDFTI